MVKTHTEISYFHKATEQAFDILLIDGVIRLVVKPGGLIGDFL